MLLKWKIFTITTFLFIVMTLFTVGCKQNVANQTESMSEKNVPQKNKSLFKLKTLFTVGIDEAKSESEEPYQFASILGAVCDKSGNIYVLDDKLYCVRVYDKQGKFVKQLFRRGQGPKELENPVLIIYNSFSNWLFIFNENGYSIKVFDLEGNFLEKLLPPVQIFHPGQIISEDQLLFINNATPNENVYSNFKIWNFRKKNIDLEISVFDSDQRSDIYNHKQLFVIHDNILWTSQIHEMSAIGFDLKTGKQIYKIKMSGDYKKNQLTEFKYMGFRGIGILAYNFLQPIILNDEVFFVLTSQDYKMDNREMLKIMQNPVYSRKSIFRIKEKSRFEKVFDFKEDIEMIIQATFDNRIIFSFKNPFPHLNVVEVLF